MVIDAAIVRVAKARRLISHNSLLAEVTQQVRVDIICVCIYVCIRMLPWLVSLYRSVDLQ